MSGSFCLHVGCECLESELRTHHAGHAGHIRPFQLVGEGRQAVGERCLVLELLLLLSVQLLAGAGGTLSVGRSSKRTSVAAQSHLQRKKAAVNSGGQRSGGGCEELCGWAQFIASVSI